MCLPAQQIDLTNRIAALTGWPFTDPFISSDVFQERGRKLTKTASTSLGHLMTSLATCVECWQILVRISRMSWTTGAAGQQTSSMYLSLGNILIWISPWKYSRTSRYHKSVEYMICLLGNNYLREFNKRSNNFAFGDHSILVKNSLLIIQFTSYPYKELIKDQIFLPLVIILFWLKIYFWSSNLLHLSDQKYYPDLGSYTSSVWNFYACSSDTITLGNKWKQWFSQANCSSLQDFSHFPCFVPFYFPRLYCVDCIVFFLLHHL